MPKNVHGGSKHKKGKNFKQNIAKESNLILAESTQVYAFVKKKTGGSTLLVDCSDNIQRSAVIPGRFYKKIWINPGDILLCDLDALGARDSCLVNHKYSPAEISMLESMKYINFNINSVVNTEDKIHSESEEDSISDFSDSDEERPVKKNKKKVKIVEELVTVDDL